MAGGERIPGTPRYRHHHLKNPGTEPFFPNFLLKEWIAGATFLLAFTLWVVFNPVVLGDKANPQDTSFIPVPDWYFLFLYQLLKYFPGTYEVFATALLPGVASLLLIFVPWLDRKKARHPYKRMMATGSMVLTTLLSIWLTNEAAVQHQAELHPPVSAGLVTLPTIPAGYKFVDTNLPGYQLFEQACANCHGKNGQGIVGPAIYAIGKYWNEAKIQSFVTQGMGAMPPRGTLANDQQVKEVATWLANQK